MWICRVFDALKLPRLIELVWHILTGVSRLTEAEIVVASSVLGKAAIRYDATRVAEGRLLTIVFKLNKNRAFSLFHTINLPRAGSHSRTHLDIVVHELTHVYQFEVVGSIYIWQALRAQRTDGYAYGGWQALIEDRKKGQRFRHYNREQQGQIAQDYYNLVIKMERPTEDPIRQAYEPFINDLRNRDL